MKDIANNRSPIANDPVARLREIYRLGAEMGLLMKKRRRDRAAIQRNFEVAAELGVIVDSALREELTR